MLSALSQIHAGVSSALLRTGSCVSKFCSSPQCHSDVSADLQDKLIVIPDSVSPRSSLTCDPSGRQIPSSSSAGTSTAPRSSSRERQTAKQSPWIVVLDYQKNVAAVKLKPAKSSVGTLQPASRAARDPLGQILGAEGCRRLAAQRAAPSTSSNLPTSELAAEGDVVPPGNRERMEGIEAWNCRKNSSRQSWNVRVQHILVRNESRADAARAPLIEDLNNPILAFECFIFL